MTCDMPANQTQGNQTTQFGLRRQCSTPSHKQTLGGRQQTPTNNSMKQDNKNAQRKRNCVLILFVDTLDCRASW